MSISSRSSHKRRTNAARLVMAAAILGATAAAGLLACGSDSTPATVDVDARPGTGDGGGGTDSRERPDDEETDGPFMSHADAGCSVKFVGPNPGTVAASVPRPGVAGAVVWQNPENAFTVDGQFASAVLDDDQVSEHLRITGYGLVVPPAATVKGVVVQLKRRGANAVADGNIELWLDGAPSDRPKFVAAGWPVNIGTHHYGQEVDTWGNDLTPAIVGKPGFGTEIYAKRRADAGTGPISADVESLLITVWYCD